jgi:hypothetical protein
MLDFMRRAKMIASQYKFDIDFRVEISDSYISEEGSSIADYSHARRRPIRQTSALNAERITEFLVGHH